ncbi:MAG: phosphatidylserine decarboxylase 1 [Phylliscum demangeonii]|nr:MAG: phosphatidylserine decarboxylase 1 [Phylliscum demangeonii]
MRQQFIRRLRCEPQLPHVQLSRPPRNRHLSSAWHRYQYQRQHHQHQHQQQRHSQESYRERLLKALRDTKLEWRPIPVALGIGFLGLAHLYRRRLQADRQAPTNGGTGASGSEEDGAESGPRRKRPRVRPEGPWIVQAMSILPLKAMSRYWGKFNELDIPYYLRVPGFKLYSWIFGVNLSEVAEPDLHAYRNLAAFFYRELKPGCRPLDRNPRALLSPADGRILQFGRIERGEVEQVKGMTYRLDAFLGSVEPEEGADAVARPTHSPSPGKAGNKGPATAGQGSEPAGITADEEFARVNGISYTLPRLLSGSESGSVSAATTIADMSTTARSSSEAEVSADLALGDSIQPWYARFHSEHPHALYYAVVYLAPGDYHRFHSPTAWVVEKRRHFAGELYSVSPYLQRSLPGLFTLNERVVLFGRWRWGFFSLTAVGATNVGSIKITFDRELRTNSLTTDTTADRVAQEAARRGEPSSGYAEATYQAASKLLGGHALTRGEEVGGFQLGSSIVMVFEAPAHMADGGRSKGWTWAVEKGQKIQVGQALGWVEE